MTDVTPEQQEQINQHKDRWMKVALNTEPSDRPRAVAAIKRMYERNDEKEPVFLWVGGPTSGCIIASILCADEDHLPTVQAFLETPKTLTETKQLAKNLGVELNESELRNHLYGYMLGSEYAYWAGFFSTMRDVLDVQYSDDDTELLSIWTEICQSTGWWLPFDLVCICSERPSKLSYDERGRLHCETGAAVVGRDGYEIHSWHGQQVPGEWIDDPTYLTAEKVFRVDNVDQRAAAAEILGWDKILKELDAKVLDEEKVVERHGQLVYVTSGGKLETKTSFGTLYEVNLPGAPGAKLLRMTCGTGRTFVEPVPEHIRTSKEAQQWKWGLPNYNPEIRE